MHWLYGSSHIRNIAVFGIVVAAYLCVPGSLSFRAQAATAADSPMGVPAFTRTLYLGLTGSDVTELQGFLKALGYFTYPSFTEYYGPVTASAVRAFQSDHGLPPTGIVDPQSWVFIASLGSDTATTSAIQAGVTGTQSAAAGVTAPSLTRALSLGASGDDVSALQAFLKALGYFTYPSITGYFGQVTADAVAAFQKGTGIDPIGIVGPQTRAAIASYYGTGAASPAGPSAPAAPAAPVLARSLSVGASGDDVSALQAFLKALGYFTYPSITGYFGQVTADAVAAFQKATGVTSDPSALGIAGPLTRTAIAAVGALSGSAGSPSGPSSGSLPSVPISYLGSQGNAHAPSSSSDSSAGTQGTVDMDFANQIYTVGGAPVSLDSLIGHDTRAADETCSWTDGSITSADPGELCITDLGLAVEPASTNEFTRSGDLSAGSWTTYTSGTGSVSGTGNAGFAPDGTDAATLVTVDRSGTSVYGFGDNAQWISTFSATAGVSSASIYLKAYSPSDVGKKVTLVLHGSSYAELDLTLTSGWTRYSIDGTNLASSDSIAIGYSGLTSNPQNGTTQFLAWGVQVEPGSISTAYIPTAGASASRDADDVFAAGALEDALEGTTGTVTVVTDSGIAGRAAALIGADGAALLGKTAGDLLESGAGGTITTLSSADWTAIATSSLAFDPSGRSIALDGGSVISDAQAKPSASAAYRLGSVGGSSAFFGGYIRHLTAEGSKLADSSIGQAPIASPGTLGTGFAFDGSNALIAPTSATLQFSSAFTVSLWVKTNGLNGSAQSMFLKNKPSGVNTGFQFGDNGPFNGGEVFSTQPNSSGGVCGDGMACFARSLINDNAWHHVVGVYDGSEVKLYLDGTLEDTRAAASAFVNNATPLYIGLGLTGSLSDVRLYSRALAQADISTLYADGSHGAVPATGSTLNAGLIAYWPMNGSSIGAGNTSAADISGNGNTAYVDVTPPSIAITSPADDATVSGTVTVKTSVSDDHGIASVKFIIDGAAKGTDTSSPYTATWNTGAVVDGTHTIVAVATDVGGNVATSSTITVTTDNGLVGNTTFYVSPDGSDNNDGTSSSSPWQTISKVNSGFYLPGDSILFEGGQTFDGCLSFSSSNVTSTSSTSPLTISSYGTGDYTIDANCSGTGDIAAIDLNGVSGVTVENGILRGNAGGASDGIWVHAPSSTTNVSDITIQNMDIGGFYPSVSHTGVSGSAEVFITGYPGGTFNNIYVGHNTLHGVDGVTSSDINGIYGFGNGKNLHNVTYEYNTIYDMGARASSYGDGIVANGVDGGVLQHNVVHDIGANSAVCGGPGGVWTYSSNDVLIQYNEVYDVRPAPYSGGCDWISYDIDGYVTNSTIQYNYSHDNFGGMIIFMTSPSTWYNNTIRYNLSVNDGDNTAQSGSHGAIGFGGTASGGSFYMYNNTIWNGNTLSHGTAYAISGNFMPTSGLIANNIFAVQKDSSGASHYLYAPISSYSPGLLFENNDWLSIGGGTPYWLPQNGTPETSLAAWQAFIPGGDANATTTDPQFVDDTWDAICGGYSATCGESFKLQNGSPLIGLGLDLHQSSSTITVGSQDYFGAAIPNGNGTGYNFGADGSDEANGIDNIKPTVSLSAPAAGSVVSGASVTLAADSSDNVAIAGVQFSIDGTAVGSPMTASPYSIAWDSTGAADGAHTVAAAAHDAAGNYATSSATIYVSNAAPVISAIATSTAGSGTMTFAWTTDTPATSQVRYGATSAYGSASALTSATSTAHSVSVSGLTPGSAYHFAVVSTDDAGRTTTSADQTFTMPDLTAPSVSVTSPSAGATVSGTITLTAVSSDNVGVAGVQFQVDGVDAGTQGTGSPYSVTWDSTGASDGTHAITAIAHDAAGNYATSSAVSVSVSNAAPVISAISSGTPSGTTATIAWNTNTPATSQVAYGTSASYDTYTTTDTSTTTTHSVPLSGLTEGTVYHFAVVSTDSAGRTSTSTDQTFTTVASPDWVESGAAIDIDFANDRAWSAATGATTPAAFFSSYTRSGTAYAADGAGVLHAFASDVPRITDKGMLVEADNTNQALWSRDFTNAVWTKTGMTAVLDQAGADGTSGSASALTASAADATVMQAITDSTSRTHVFSVYLKRLAGTGEIDLTMDGGATWSDVTSQVSSSAYSRVSVNTTGTNPTIGIRLAASGDSVAADFAQEEVPGSSSMFDALTSPVVTTSAAASRDKDHTKFVSSVTSLLNSSDFSILVTGTGSSRVSAGGVPLIGCATFAGYLGLPAATTVGEGGGCFYGSAHSVALGSGTLSATTTVGMSRDSTPEASFVGNGGSVMTIKAATKTQTYYNLGMESANGPYYDGYFTRVTFWDHGLDTATLQALTAQ